MNKRLNTWALVLAGGEGSRLHSLTRNVPKQFCSLQGGPSLLQEALQRASTVAPLQRICTVVAEQHRQWWTPVLSYLPDQNVIVQPQNRGTAYGILLPLLRIADRDPNAIVVVLPADHFLRDEETMMASVGQAAELAAANRESLYLLGVEPEEPDTELGYIVPAPRSRDIPARVLRFIEKPTQAQARALVEQGALWNIFIMAASVRALLGLFDGRYAPTIAAMRDLNESRVASLYEKLPVKDFSRDVLQGNESMLKVVSVPSCGWTDLGTPKRIGLTLQSLGDDDGGASNRYSPHVNLADQYARMHAGQAHAEKFGHVNLRA